MRRVISILAILAIAISNVSAQANSAMTAAENVYRSMMDIRKIYGKEEEKIFELMRSPESGFINTSVEIIPFRGKAITLYINKAIEAFNKDSEKGYNFRKFNGATIGAETFGTFKGDDMNSYIMLMNRSEGSATNFIYLEVKCADNPQMRTFYGVKWMKLGEETSGSLYFITSKRPDLILSEADKKTDDANEEDVLSSLSEDAQKRIKVLGAMIDTYSDELNDLQKKDNDTVASDVKETFREQMKLIVKKRQELLDKMHKIILEETN